MHNKKMIYIILIVFILIVGISTTVSGKYIIEYINIVAKIDIDRNPPKIELISIKNTNKGYEKYANRTHTITARIKIIEKNITKNYIEDNRITVKVGNMDVKAEKMEIKEREKKSDYIIYDIILKGIKENGNLSIEIPKGTIVDKSLNVNQEKIINTNIKIDNIAPKGTFKEKIISNGKVEANIVSNECIRNVEGWNISTDKLTLKKEFTNNIAYEIKIYDFAQNETIVKVDISKATNIQLVFASHNSEIGWTFGYGNYDIAGKEALIRNDPSLKTEALAFHLKGNIDKEFVRVRANVYSHWGPGSKGVCGTSGMIYDYGQNPSSSTWKTMNSKDLVTIGNERYFQFGGSLINKKGRTDINGNKPIPEETANIHPYGISGIAISLKDYSYYSIVYQILVVEKGWLTPASDGQETKYQYNKPMTAIRVTLVPKTEKKYIIEKWNKDVGTFNIGT